MKMYKSKIGWIFFVQIALLLSLCISDFVKGNYVWSSIILVMLLVLVYFTRKTGYTISGNNLKIKLSFLANETIDINTIRIIEKTNSILSSPALSLDRIRIKYNKFDEIIVSPKEKQEFVNHLLAINPNIEIKL